MPVVDRREFEGHFGVKENSRRLANYRYLEIQLMEMIGGWSHTTPRINLKATFGYHIYDHAQAANLLGERLEQLRSGRLSEEPATDDFAHLCEYVWNLDSVVDRLVAVYRVLEPHLVSTCVYHADATDPMTDTPTVRLLRNLAGIAQSHVAWGQAVLDNMTRTADERRHALDLTVANDNPGASPDQEVTRFGEGPAIKVMDTTQISLPGIVRHLREIARDLDIPLQLEVLNHGGSDTSLIQRLRSGVAVVTLSIPARYIHTVNETVATADVDRCVTLLTRYLAVAHTRDYAEDI